MTDLTDEQNRIIADFELDAEEAALEAFQEILRETEGKIDSSKSGLLKKLEIYPTGDFPISPFSNYRDPVWKFTNEDNGAPMNVYFDREILGANDLKRSLVYHMAPAFTPFNRIRSFSSTKSKAHEYKFIDIYLLSRNRLSAIPAHINLITTRMLNEALDEAKASGQSSHYLGLFSILRFWLALSHNKLLPEGMNLPEHVVNIDNQERSKDVLDTFTGSLQSWIPYSESELEKLINHSLFWIEEAAPRLLKAKNYIIRSGLDTYQKGVLRRAAPQTDFEQSMSITIKGTPVLNYSLVEKIKDGYTTYTYSWVAEFAQAIDKVRSAVFVFVALVTGMRRNELGVLKFEDIILDKDGLYWIDITRFKTSTDPNYSGNTDRLPLPYYVGRCIEMLKELRGLWSFYKQGYIFQSAFAVIAVSSDKPDLPSNIVSYLEESTGVERIHPHRFRKTIAEILINLSERNIDIIRLLFGHHSYAMTLKYIARNPYLVRSVAVALEESYSKDFHEILTAVRDGSYSGHAADRLARKIAKRPEDFKGKRLRISILTYVSHLLSAGSPIYVGRTAVGTYCVSGESFNSDNLPPCLIGHPNPDGRSLPDPSNCQIECRNAVIIGKAKIAMKDSLNFYESLLVNGGGSLTGRARRMIHEKIEAHKRHLANLNNEGASKPPGIPLVEIY
ncbi:tyrosine-type recombinase/integrase [Pseudomonas aeruginosa]|nr:tyrosine-type recombinase/integrase [Pseudomonas aeruginosa]